MTPGTFLLGIYDDGLLKLDTKSNRIERIKLDMSNIDILSFFKDNDGTMWIGAEYGIYTYKDGVIRKEEDIIRELSDKSIYGILRDRQGRLWMGSYGGRITIFDKDYKVVTRLDHSNGFKTNGINDLFMDSQGGVWAATRNGIGYIKIPVNRKSLNSMVTATGLKILSYAAFRKICKEISGSVPTMAFLYGTSKNSNLKTMITGMGYQWGIS